MLAVKLASASNGEAADADVESELQAALALEPDPARGQIAYEPCSVCHGENGGGSSEGTFPRLAGQHASVVVKQLVDIRAGKRENPIMHPYAERLMDPQEIADVAAHVSKLPRPSAIGFGPGADLDLGERLYRRDCRSCHGERAEGDAARFIPALAGQHYAYLLRQIREISAGRRTNVYPEIVKLIARLRDAELKALVDYASRLEPIVRRNP